MKTLLLNGSPRPNGNTASLIRELKAHLEGEIIEISAFYSGIAPCIDCRGCWESAQCVVHDGMDVIYGDDFDNVVIATPVYFGTMPGSMLNLLSRMQPWHVATHFLKEPLVQRPKKGCRHCYRRRQRQCQAGIHAHGCILPDAQCAGIRRPFRSFHPNRYLPRRPG